MHQVKCYYLKVEVRSVPLISLRLQSGGRRIRGTSRHSNLEAETVDSSGFVAGDGEQAAGFEFKHRFYTVVRFFQESF